MNTIEFKHFSISVNMTEEMFAHWLMWAMDKVGVSPSKIANVDDGALNNELVMTVTLHSVTDVELLNVTETLEEMLPCGNYDHDEWFAI